MGLPGESMQNHDRVHDRTPQNSKMYGLGMGLGGHKGDWKYLAERWSHSNQEHHKF